MYFMKLRENVTPRSVGFYFSQLGMCAAKRDTSLSDFLVPKILWPNNCFTQGV